MNSYQENVKTGLYQTSYEHDACGVGFLVNLTGKKTHDIVDRSIRVLERLLHRGATGGDAETGDGAGVLFQIPDDFFRQEMLKDHVSLPPSGEYGVAMIFLPRNKDLRLACQALIKEIIDQEGFKFLGWRIVPCQSSSLGEQARQEQPYIMQCLVAHSSLFSEVFERKLYVLRKEIEHRVDEKLSLGDQFYIPSFSSRTIVYKGLMMATQVSNFYTDLRSPLFMSALAVVHQRYSTNTFPSWKLAQPFRYLAHNGEINTLRGNLNQMQAREKLLASPLFGSDIKKILPVIDSQGSDSACLDNAFELLVQGGRSNAHAMMMLIPQAWGAKYPMGPDLRGFF